MTPEEFALTMSDIRKRSENDPEVCHVRMDDCLCDTLRELGYGEGIDIFNDTYKWYS